MKAMLTKALYDSPLGTITLVGDGTSLTALHLPKWEDTVPSEGLSNHLFTKEQHDLSAFAETRRWLDCYFSGQKPDFIPPLKPQGTPFQQKVWHELLTIAYGQTVSYGEIARRIGCRSAQAIGQAVHRNPIAIIIPCHRVIGADGSLTGYASGLGIKRWLLKFEE